MDARLFVMSLIGCELSAVVASLELRSFADINNHTRCVIQPMHVTKPYCLPTVNFVHIALAFIYYYRNSC